MFKVIHKHYHEIYPGILDRLHASDLAGIDNTKWTFDWHKEIFNYPSYKLFIQGDHQIQGLISFEEVNQGEGYHIHSVHGICPPQ